MDGHPMMASKKQQTTKAPIRQPTGIFEHNPLFDGMDDGTDKPSDEDRRQDEMETSYVNSYEEPENNLPFATNVDYQYDLPAVNSPSSNYLIGPMVVRVQPDGSPVDEDKTKPLPIDDDRMIIRNGYFTASKQPSLHLEAPSIQTNYQKITRQNSKNQH